jgi:hypothetical protein
MKATLKVFISILLLLCITIVFLEISVRIFLYVSLNTYLQQHIDSRYQDELRKLQFFNVKQDIKKFDPVCIFLMERGNLRAPDIERDAQGVLTNESAGMDFPEKTSDEIRILCVGDSSTFGAGVSYWDAYPAQLERLLSEHFKGKKIRVYNAGVPGGASRQVKRIFQLYLTQHENDIVIWRKGAALTDTFDIPVLGERFRIALWRLLYELRIFRVLCVIIDNTQGPKSSWGGHFADRVYDIIFGDKDHSMAQGHFVSDFDMVAEIARGYDTDYILAVDYVMRNFVNKEQIEITTDYGAYEAKGISPVLYTAPAFQQLLEQSSVDHIFIDECHLTEAGNQLLAQQVYEFIVNEGWIESIIQKRAL